MEKSERNRWMISKNVFFSVSHQIQLKLTSLEEINGFVLLLVKTKKNKNMPLVSLFTQKRKVRKS